jgi:hypothetical protein
MHTACGDIGVFDQESQSVTRGGGGGVSHEGEIYHCL